MLNLFSDLRGFVVEAQDGEKGSVDDIYFNEHVWKVRYVVADIGSLFHGRKALIGRDLLLQPDLERRVLPVALSKSEVEDAPAPGPGTAETVGALEEGRLRDRAAEWPAFVLGPLSAAYTPILAEQQIGEMRRRREDTDQAPALGSPLRSAAEVHGYKVRAKDDGIGTVDDFLIDTQSWELRCVAVDTGEWLPGKRVVLPVDAISDIDWNLGEVTVDLTRDEIETSPPVDSVAGLKRSDANALLAHYGRSPL